MSSHEHKLPYVPTYIEGISGKPVMLKYVCRDCGEEVVFDQSRELDLTWLWQVRHLKSFHKEYDTEFDYNQCGCLTAFAEKYSSLKQVTDMEQAKPKSQDKVTAKPPKHSCTAEIIAELERFYNWIQSEGRLHSEIKEHYEDRIKSLKAKETQL